LTPSAALAKWGADRAGAHRVTKNLGYIKKQAQDAINRRMINADEAPRDLRRQEAPCDTEMTKLVSKH
jgi:hypothetical protein